MEIRLKNQALLNYTPVLNQMQQFTSARTDETSDEIWVVEHQPVYTLGLNGKTEHVLDPGKIAVVKTDRGGQVTYHGPGQVVIYLLADLRRLNIGVRQIVTVLENAMIAALAEYGVSSQSKSDAPGVYVNEKKIGSVGLRIKKGCSYHGLSLNNNMDLDPFLHINPCGHAGLEVTQLADLGVNIFTHELAVPVVHNIIRALA